MYMAPTLCVGASPRRSASPADAYPPRSTSGRGASRAAFPRRAWGRSMVPTLRVGTGLRRSASI